MKTLIAALLGASILAPAAGEARRETPNGQIEASVEPAADGPQDRPDRGPRPDNGGGFADHAASRIDRGSERPDDPDRRGGFGHRSDVAGEGGFQQRDGVDRGPRGGDRGNGGRPGVNDRQESSDGGGFDRRGWAGRGDPDRSGAGFRPDRRDDRPAADPPSRPDQRNGGDRRTWNRDRGWGRNDDRGGWNGDDRWGGDRGWTGDRGSRGDRGWRDDRGWNGNRNWTRDWRNDRRYDWGRYRDSNRGAYRLPRYYAPHGWGYGYRRFSIGAILSSVLWDESYWIDDPYSYRLPDAYGPYRWVLYYDDALLIDIRTGRVVDVVNDIFW